MLIKEFRVVLPFTVDEYRVGQLFSVAKTSSQETSNGEGVEVLKNEPYKNEDSEGQYTEKIYHLGSRLPGWVRALIPSSALKLEEKAWNAYPYCKTVLKSPFLGERFTFIIESRHALDNGSQNNIHNLSEKDLKNRDIEIIDITDQVEKKEYKAEEDPTLVRSEKANRGPLAHGTWMQSKDFPVMCAYKLVTVEFKMFGFQTKVENFMMKIEKDLFTKFHRQVYCWLDEWFGWSMDQVREYEQKTKENLDQKLKETDPNAKPAAADASSSTSPDNSSETKAETKA
ncbi:phosphatidylinositol transfer protein 1 [Cavenderia fasciculata]|uniref:Phosphatidylinositol transfer protein 1 n=1 Tax=Cavenderia fasciculata TaxID=261658 RepID=F4PM60_CACFS|nr:phosphatidylinositol transfer protein 1 [Cavenderia fasciculata]EGG23560.1 phosphatidylinositol transfer protein 1 [Cavenderia fasciculata]|eukprot:XP_004361411.1 phosphatidylinositol transfer protein 1 [Cavenderia fasciculata]